MIKKSQVQKKALRFLNQTLLVQTRFACVCPWEKETIPHPLF